MILCCVEVRHIKVCPDWPPLAIGLLTYWLPLSGGTFPRIVFWNKTLIKLVYIGKEKYRVAFTTLYIEANSKGLIDRTLMFSLAEHSHVIGCEDKDLVQLLPVGLRDNSSRFCSVITPFNLAAQSHWLQDGLSVMQTVAV